MKLPTRVPLPTPNPMNASWAPGQGTNYFPPAPAAPMQRQPGMMDKLANNYELFLNLGAGLMGGRTAAEQWSGGAQGAAAGIEAIKGKRDKNKTVEWLRKNAPEYADAVDAGAISVGDAYKLSLESKKAKTPKVSWQELPDGTFGWANETDMSWNPIGKAQKPDGGLSVTLPDGTTVQQGSFSNQDQKNMANRVTDAQDVAASGTTLKQTASMLRKANENVGYSGVGGGVVGSIFDTAEQFGVDAPGTPGGRALMKSGGLDVALQQVQKTKGAISNAEMSLFMAASPGLQNTPEGNAMIIDMVEAVGDRQVLRATEMEKWRQQYGTLDGFEGEWTKYISANPLIVQKPDGSVGFAGGTQNVAPPAPAGGVSNWQDYFGGQ